MPRSKDSGAFRGMQSLFGEMNQVLVPACIGFEDPREIGRALFAWRFGLSKEFVQTLELLAQGKNNSALAVALGLSDEKSVSNRIQAALDKMNVHSRAHAAAITAMFGLGPEVRFPSENANFPGSDSPDS